MQPIRLNNLPALVSSESRGEVGQQITTMKTTTLISFFSCILLFWGCHHGDKPNQQEKVRAVTVTEARMQGVAEPVHTTGKLSSKTEVKLSFKTGGIINRIFVNEGQSVRKGTALASLNLAEIEARKQQAQQAYDKAVRDHQRVENLYRDSVATLEHLQDAHTAMEVARTNLEIAEFNLKYSTIVAPVSGKILMKLAEENEIVSAGQPVFLFGSTDDDWVVNVNLTDRDIVQVNLGDRASIGFDAYPGVGFDARVTQIGKAADPYTGTYEVELTVIPGKYELASGFIAKADIVPPVTDSCLLIPIDVLVEAEGHEGKLFVVKDSVASMRKVSIRQIAGMICITAGLEPGEQVVLEGAQYLDDGEKVHIANPVSK